MNSTDIEGRLSEITERLSKLYPKSIDLSLERITRFLDQVDKPHSKLPPIIHVAGTNGKGSTIAYLRHIITQAGLKCHSTTSPHLIDFNERIVINGHPISTPDLMTLLDECDAVNAGEPITYFEIAIAATFMAFARAESDFTLLETGLGGRLDATNVVPSPEACIITSIGYDHMDYLGETLSEIAFEKCGIMKKGSPCIVAPQTGDAIRAGVLDTIKEQAIEKGARLYLYGRDWFVEETPYGFRLSHSWGIEDYPFPALVGKHQINNAASVIVALRVIENQRDEQLFKHSHISEGLKRTKWAGRLEKIESLPFGLDGNNELWVDGGHNENAGHVLGQQAEYWAKETSPKDLTVILGMLNRKDPITFLKSLVPHIKNLICVPVSNEDSSYTAEETQTLLRGAYPDLSVSICNNTMRALSDFSEKNSRILVTGSLYLVGDLLKKIQ